MVKNIGQGNKNQAGARVRFYPIGEAGRKDDQSGGQGHKGIQERYVDRLSHQGMILTDIAAENSHTAHTDRQGKEGLVHGCLYHVPDSGFPESGKIRPQIKGKAFAAAGCQNAVDSQYQHDHDQCCHHDLGDPLYTLLQAHGQNKKAHNDGYGHKAPLTDGRSHHIAEFGSDSLRIQAFKGSGRRRKEILDHPAADDGIKHHQNIVAGHRGIAVQVPETALWLQPSIHGHRTDLTGPSHGKFHGHYRDTHDCQKNQINQDKGASAVLAHQPGKLPDISDTDGTSCRQQNKAQTASQLFTFFQNRILLCSSEKQRPLPDFPASQQRRMGRTLQS